MKDRRRERVESSIVEAVRQVIQRGLGDPRLEGCMATIMHADLAPDGKNITLGVSVLPATAESRAIAALSAAAAHIRHEVGELIDARALPVITFTLDRSLKKQAGVIEALSKVVAEREERESSQTSTKTEPGGQP